MSNWVAIDWGTTNFRAFLLDELSIVDEYVSNHGIKNIENEDFEKILKKNLSKWINKYEQLDIFICGMKNHFQNIGSKIEILNWCTYFPFLHSMEKL